MIEAFLDRWAHFLSSFVTQRRVRRCAIASAITAVTAFLIGWALLPPQPRWIWHYGPLPHLLLGFSPGGRWLATAGYRGVPPNDMLWIWDLKSASATPAYALALPWTSPPSRVEQMRSPDGLLFQWSANDRQLVYLSPAIAYQRAAVHFVELNQGTEQPPWELPDIVWHRPDHVEQGTARPQPVERFEMSPHGGWLLLHRQSGIAVADPDRRQILFAIGNAANSVMHTDGRRLVVQRQAADGAALMLGDNPAAVWKSHDLVTGESAALRVEQVPSLDSHPKWKDFGNECVSADSRLLARTVETYMRPGKLELYDLPLRPPWGLITVVSIVSAAVVVATMELRLGWRHSFEVNNTPDGEESDIDAD